MQLAAAETEREVLRERLSAVREATTQNVFINGLGGACLGFIPYSFDETGAVGAVVMATIGLAACRIGVPVERKNG